MDTSDRHDLTLPVRSPASPLPIPSRAAASFGAPPRGDGGGSIVQINPVSILRGLMRNWWKILAAWLVLAAPVVYAIYAVVKPTYEAMGVVQIKPSAPEVFNTGASSAQSLQSIIDTEIQHIRSDTILKMALADESVVDLPSMKNNPDALTSLKKNLEVENPRNTQWVRISLDSTDAAEAANVVNAVITTYMDAKQHLLKNDLDDAFQKNLAEYLAKMKKDKEKMHIELTALMNEGNIDPGKVTAPKAAAAPDQRSSSGEAAKSESSNDVSYEQYRKWTEQLMDIRFKLLKSKSLLAHKTRDFQGADVEEASADPSTLSRDELEKRMYAAFRSEPTVVALLEERELVQRALKHADSGTRKGIDPAKQRYREQLKHIEDRHNEMWERYAPEIKERVLAAAEGRTVAADPGGLRSEAAKSTAELKAEVEDLEHEHEAVTAMMNQAKVANQRSNSETFRAQILKAEIDGMTADERQVSRRLEDLKFKANNDFTKVQLIERASVPPTPSDSKRLKLMAAAPMGILALLLGIFSLLEIKAERVGDPDMLSTRVQSQVYSLPPIPMARAQRRLGAPGGDDHIDRFIQRLDHLRFAICGDHPEVGLGRCVLISSAVGSEGKTTLAAQLAARCGHAGHTTLLIDADLRRGALSPLLDVAEGLGLSDVLTRDDLNVEDVVIPVQGGTFHLLSAGTPTQDTSRVFQGRSFGMLIARLRQLYDLIIIDSPPILPVPDALIMGRWTDGVVLASRYDVSRAPQVERARRQLDLSGIPVLGTVINGMRTSDSYYGRYTYSRQSAGTVDREGPADATAVDQG